MLRSAVEFRELRPGDLEYLAANLRQADLEELAAAGRHDPLEVLQECVAHSAYSRVACADGVPGCVFGARPTGTVLAPEAVVWMLGTELVPQHRRVLALQAPRYIRAMLETFGKLYNCVHTRNTTAKRWLERAGAAMSPAIPHPVTGELFHYFEIT